MRFCLSIITEDSYQQELAILQEFIHRKQAESAESIKIILFVAGGPNRQLKAYLRGIKGEIIFLPADLSWQNYLDYFQAFFNSRFYLMFDHPTYIFMYKDRAVVASSLLIKAMEYLGHQVKPIYFSGEKWHQMDLETVAPKKDLKYLLAYFLNQYDYKSALAVIEQDDFLIDPGQKNYGQAMRWAIKALVYRFNCDFTKAQEAWQRSEALWSENQTLYQATIAIFRRLSGSDQPAEAEKIQELLRQLLIRLHTGDISGFLTRLYRFREILIEYIWTFGQRAAKPLNSRLPAYVKLDHLRHKMAAGAIQGYRGAYFYLKNGNLADTLNIRNKSFIGHGRQGFSNKDWISAYLGNVISSPKAIENFEQEVKLLLEDLGLQKDNNYQAISKHLTSVIKFYL